MVKLGFKHDHENPKVNEQGYLLPAHQRDITAGQDSYITIPATPSPSTTILGSGNQYYFDLESDEVGRIDDLCLRFRITCSTADVECVPPAYWFSRIVLEAEKGSGDELQHIYPENIVLWDYFTKDRVSREKCAYMNNYHITKYNSESAEKLWVSEKTKFKAGETRDVYIPLPALFLHLNAIDMKHIRQDFRIRLEFSSDIVISGDRTNLSLDNLNAVIRTFAEESYDYQHRMEYQRKWGHKYIYLDHERLTYNDKTLTASQTTKFALDQFVGKCPFVVVVIKNNSSPVASDKSLFDFVEIGTDGTFDITNSGSQSLLGNGTAVKQDYIYETWNKQTGNPHIKGVYLIPFCDNVKKSVAGSVNGYFEFVGLKDYLDITFDSAPTQEVHTISLASLGTTGTYRYAFENGGISDQDCDYDETASDIKAIIDAMPQLAERNISVSVNNGIDATTSQTITFDARANQVSEELGKITILGNNTPKVNSTSVSTQGQSGFTTGSSYQVEIHMYKFKCLEVEKNGKINCVDL